MATLLNQLPFFLLTLPFLLLPLPAQSRQPYINNVQNDCYGTNSSSALGYSCSLSDPQSCSSFLTFRAQTNYQSPSQIARLLNADPASLARINRVSDLHLFPLDSLVLVPISCRCTGGELYQANSSYVIQSKSETYQTVANNTYGGLTACQALMAQNPGRESRHLYPGTNITVPVRCACPTRDQTSSGAKFLLVYLLTWDDDISQIAARFNVSFEDVLDANSLDASSTVFPFTTILVPLPAEPSPTSLISPPPPPAPITKNSPRGNSSGSDRKPIIVGIAVSASVLVFLGLCITLFLCSRRRRGSRKEEESKLIVSPPTFNEKVRHVVHGSLNAYTYEDIKLATGSFSDQFRIGSSSVYRASINSAVAAVKRTRADIQNEISVLNQINHSNIVRLSGFCYGVAENFLVFEFAENGSLSDWLHHLPLEDGDLRLPWTARMKIACGIADALNYLHTGATPPLLHRNLKSSNILLGRDFKAKLSNFAMARPSSASGGGGDLTAHVVGTRGYLAPEYLEHGLVSAKLDIFAFGVVLIEILSGEAAAEDGKGRRLAAEIAGVLSGEDVKEKLKKVMDPRLGEDYPFDLAFAVAQLAEKCVKEDYNLRPGSRELLLTLTAIYSSSVEWDQVEASDSTSPEDF